MNNGALYITYLFPNLFNSSTNQLTAPCTWVWRYRIQLISLAQVQLLVEKKPEGKRQQIRVEDGVHGSQTLQMVHLPADGSSSSESISKSWKRHRHKGEKEHMWLERMHNDVYKVHVLDCLLLMVDFCLHFFNATIKEMFWLFQLLSVILYCFTFSRSEVCKRKILDISCILATGLTLYRRTNVLL